MDIITGEKIQDFCKQCLTVGNEHNFNPYFKNKQDKFINLQFLNTEINNSNIIFCFTHVLPFLINKLHLFKNPFVLVSGNSDHNFNFNLRSLIESNKIIKIVCQNMDINHSKVIPLPIGLANSMWKHGNLELFKTGFNIPKTKELYFYFTIGTSPAKRTSCLNKLKKKGLIFGEPIEYENYVKYLSSHKFAICPDGNGIDTHRLWECLYLKVVPICLSTISTQYFSKRFPIIILDDWDDLDLTKLNYNDFDWSKYHELDIAYYTNLINTHSKSV